MSFGLDFLDKPAVLASLSATVRTHVHTERARSMNFADARTVLVEGDNLAMLHRLREAYFERVDTIYIDPPYNTGHDFVYRDRRAESEAAFLQRTGQVDDTGSPLRPNLSTDGRYHSAWLAMMYPRLWHARALLRPEGLLFVSIDDHEVHHLRVLLDEIFGEDCFIAQIVVVTNRGGRDYLRIATGHEYLLVYGASPRARVRELPKPPPKGALEDSQGSYVLRELRNRNPKFHPANRPNLFYPLYVDPDRDDGHGGLAVSLRPRAGYEVVVEPRNRAGAGSVWRWGQPKVQANLVEDDPVRSQVVAKRRRDGGYNICEKHRKATAKAKGLWDEPSMRTEQGTIDLRELLGRPVFDHPKPVAMVRRCVQLGCDPQGIVLDFFAGSGTTAQAVAQVDALDGGQRTCLLGQWPEPIPPQNELVEGAVSITDITAARVERACGALRRFSMSGAPAPVEVKTLEDLRTVDRDRIGVWDPFDLALRHGVGLHAAVEDVPGWQVLRDGGRVLAIGEAGATPASLDALDLPQGARIVLPDGCFTDAQRVAASTRYRVSSEAD